jgi:hypothetical protein
VSSLLLPGQELEPAEKLSNLLESLKGTPNISPLLPMMFSLRGKPFTLADHFHFEPMYSSELAARTVWKTGRQVSKSTSAAILCVAMAGTIPFFNQLYITPLFETTRRFSSTYVQPFIDQSPIRSVLVDGNCTKSVLQRSFRNSSIMFFSYALNDATRLRGFNVDKIWTDEAQDVDPAIMDIALQCSSGSRYDIAAYTGTSKTTDTLLEAHWIKSSQAEWHIWCHSCGYENIPSISYDLEKMVGPQYPRREISEAQPGVVCAKCQKPIYPRTGRWIHHNPGSDNRIICPGYHVPQIILPLHYADPAKWRTILTRREGAAHSFWNEVCGESYDIGAKLISKTELIDACKAGGWDNSVATVESRREQHYVEKIISVDWGGGGETEISRTVMVAMGMRPDMTIDVLFGYRFLVANDYPGEVAGIFGLMRRFGATHVVHDFGGQGAVREHIMVDAGLPLWQIVPVSYVGTLSAGIMRHVGENSKTNTRAYYQLHKARAFLQTCELIRRKKIRFFKYDYIDSDRPGLINNFLSLIEHTIEGASGRSTYSIRRSATGDPDDFANAVNIGSCSLFQMRGEWPDLAIPANISASPEMIAQINEDADSGRLY